MKNPIILTTITCLTADNIHICCASFFEKCAACFDCLTKARELLDSSSQGTGQTPIVNVYVNGDHHSSHSPSDSYRSSGTYSSYSHIPNALINDINSANLREIELTRLNNNHNGDTIRYSQQTTTSVTTTEIIEEISPVHSIYVSPRNTFTPRHVSPISASWPEHSPLPEHVHHQVLHITPPHSPMLIEYGNHNHDIHN